MKTPEELATEMEQMAQLHQNTIWAEVMLEGAAMIRELATPIEAPPDWEIDPGPNGLVGAL